MLKGLSMNRSAIRFLLAALLALGCAVAASAQQPRFIMGGPPRFRGLDVDANLFITRQGATLAAYDIDSGETRWTYEAWPFPDLYLVEHQGKDHVILHGEGEKQTKTVVLEKASGKICWERMERSGDPWRYGMVLPDSDWFLLHYARGKSEGRQAEEGYFLLFSPDGAGRYRVPEGLRPQEWREEGKTLVLTGTAKEALRLVYWDLGIDTTRDIGTYSDGLYGGRLHDGSILLYRYVKDKNPQTLTVVDGDSGRLLRQVTLPEALGAKPEVVRGGKAVLILGENEDRLWMLDPAEDKVLAALHHPNHEFLLESVSADASGRIWVVSHDGEHHYFLWPVEKGAVPRKVFDRGPFFPGQVWKVLPPHVITLTRSKEGSSTLHAINFEERRIVAVWKPSASRSFHRMLPCASMRRCAVMLSGSGAAEGRGGYQWEILEAGGSEALLKFENAWHLALSPDGEYVATQDTLEGCTVLVQVSTGETLYEFPRFEDYWSSAAFAKDSRTVAVFAGYDAFTVIRIKEEGITETPLEFPEEAGLSSLCFSPDGTRLLSATRGKAWLHDTLTGNLLYTFVEPQQLRSEHVHTPEVFGIKMPFVNYLGDLAGNFTNLANSKPELEAAFIGNGARVVTVAEAQLIRVWDAGTGRNLHTIEPGLSNTRDEYGHMRNTITLSENGAYALAANSFDTRTTLWDLTTGAAAKKYTDWKTIYRTMHVSDDGKSIYLAVFQSLYWLEGR